MKISAKRFICAFTVLGLLFSGGLAIVDSAYADNNPQQSDGGSGWSVYTLPPFIWVVPGDAHCTQGYSRTFDPGDHNCPGS